MTANPKKFNDEDQYDLEVVWNGALQKEGREKGELLGDYDSKSTLIASHSYVVRRIRGKIVAIQQPITKEKDDDGEN